jgi:hypothetical protein
MNISEMAPELVGCLRRKLGAAAQNNPTAPTANTSAELPKPDHKLNPQNEKQER